MVKPVISFEDWLKIDIRIGRIVEASKPAWSNKLLELKVDFGEELGTRTILTGMSKWYEPEVFLGKQSLFLINLPPRKMGEGQSEGMLLAGESDEEGKPALILYENLAAPGTILT